MKQLFSICLIAFLCVNANSQFYESGQDPASIQWEQINTPNFQIIFPSTFDSAANKLANSLEYLYTHVAKTLKHNPKKISVILHTHSAYSNGFVTWAPKRMELYTTPPQDLYGQDWVDQLAIHELRHVVQIDKLNQGITRIMSILLGQQAVGAVAGLVPRWFYEGDAVFTETALTNTGRGRMGSFTMEMKSLVLDIPKPYSFEKMLLGSYKDYVPDRYNFGYAYVGYNRYIYGDSLFEKNITYTAQNPYYPFTFNRSFKKQTKHNNIALYKQAYQGLNSQWQSQVPSYNSKPGSNWTAINKKHYTSYRLAQLVNDTTLFAVKSGIDQLKQFVYLYKNRKEKVVHTPGGYKSDRISLVKNKLVWAEEIPNIRWSNGSYSNIKIKDLTSGKVRMLTHKTRYFAPSLSPDLQQITVVNISLKNEISLAFINAQTGKFLSETKTPYNSHIQDPVWAPDGKSVITVLSGKKGKALYRYTVSQDSWEEIVTWSWQNLSMPFVTNNQIFYSSDASGTNNIYTYQSASNKIIELTGSKYGAFDPYFYEKDSILYYSDYTSQGFCLKFQKVDTNLNAGQNKKPIHADLILQKGISQEHFNFQDSITPNHIYEKKGYSKLTHTFNFHSWAPFYIDYNNLQSFEQAIQTGITILSQDKLGSCLSSFGLAYVNGNPLYKTNFTYKGWLPVIDFSLDYGNENPYSSIVTLNPEPIFKNYRVITNTQIYLPLNFTRGKFITSTIPFVNWKYDNQKFYNRSNNTFLNELNTISIGLNFYKYLRLSYRDLAPRFGISLISEYLFKPINQNVFGSRSYIKARVYFPGFINHHSLQFTTGYFNQEVGDYMFNSSLAFPRGYKTYASSSLNTISADYSFPLFYPDFHIGSLIYLKRIKSNLFTDWGKVNYSQPTQTIGTFSKFSSELLSTGIDITTDSHILRLMFPINFGLRSVYFPNEQTFSSYIIFGIDFNY